MDAQLLELSAAGMASAGVAAFFVGAGKALRWRQLNRRLDSHIAGGQTALSTRLAASEPSAGLPGADAAAGISRRLTRSSFGATLQARLTRAGMTLKPSEFILLQIAVACTAMLLGLVLAPKGAGAFGRFAVIAAMGALGYGAPLLLVSLRERRRVAKFERQLPQAIDSMAGTLQAGSTLPQAMEIIAREMLPPIGVEFRRVLREVELGLSFTESLAGLVQRIPSTDLLLVSSAISIQNRVGGDLAEILRTISHTIRERLRIRGEINVLTAQGRYSTYIISGLPVLLFFYLYMTNYSYVSQLFLPGVTRVLLVGGITGIVVGFYSMRKIVSVDV